MKGAFVSAVVVAALVAAFPRAGESQAYKPPRTASGQPDLNGFWQAVNTANWDLEAHEAAAGPVLQLGAAYAVPPGPGVVVDGPIPYKPDALAMKKKYAANALREDAEVKCYLPGVPRMMYMPYPVQVVQSASTIVMMSEFATAIRTIYMNSTTPPPADTWMGWSNGRWEGETLVIDTTDFNDLSWFDRSGNFHSDALHVVERITALAPNHLNYEATIEDPKVFTRPWKISMPLYRRIEKNAQVLEYKCVEFAEDVVYGALRKVPLK